MPSVKAPSSVNGVATKRVSVLAAAPLLRPAQKLKTVAKRTYGVMQSRVNFIRERWMKSWGNSELILSLVYILGASNSKSCWPMS
jgi:hypothetical protein